MCYFNEMKYVKRALRNRFILAFRSAQLANRRGQTLVEYALILAIISVVAIGVMINLGKQVTGVYSTVNSVIASAQASH
jgi:Flp pilus assembly pilin Flp